MAASIAGFVIVVFAGVRVFGPDKNESLIPEVFVEENLELFIDDIDLFALENNTSMPGIFEEGLEISDNSIIDYLLTENIEISEIYEQL